MLTAQLVKSMDDHHLVASLYAEQDPLTSSAAEVELLTRFEAMLKALAEVGFDDPELLKAELELAAKFRALANDAGDFFTRLNDLITTNQE